MTDTKQTNGNLIGFINTRKQPGDKYPAFNGKLSLPGIATERGFALWAHTSERTGDVVLSGRAGSSAHDQVMTFAQPDRPMDTDTTIMIAQKDGAEGLSIKPHEMVLFTNKQKDAENQNRPDYWGYYNPGKGEPLMRLAAWMRTDRNGNAMLTGSLQKDEPNRNNDQDFMPPDEPERDDAAPGSRETLRPASRPREEERVR